MKLVLRYSNVQLVARTLDIPVPPTMSLPISELQRRAEELEFSELLNQVCSFIAHTQSPRLKPSVQCELLTLWEVSGVNGYFFPHPTV